MCIEGDVTMLTSSTPSSTVKHIRKTTNGRKFSIDVDAIGMNSSMGGGKSFVGFASKIPGNEYIQTLVNRSFQGVMSGYSPTLSEVGVGGTYFLKDNLNRRIGVFKPNDEEMGCLNNPKGFTPLSNGSIDYNRSRGVMGGEAAFRECAAYVLDHEHFSGVPATDLVACNYPGFHNSPLNNSIPSEENFKIGSFQEFKEHDFDTEDISPSKASRFPVNEVHKIALLDIRLFNTDRHGGNILVRKVHSPRMRRPDLDKSPQRKFRRSNSGSDTEERGQTQFWMDIGSDEDEDDEEDFDDYDEDFSDMSFSLASSTSSSCSVDDGDDVTYELIPIDHGYTLPTTITGLNESWFEWLNWPQAKTPFSSETKDYIARLDVESDIALLRQKFGEWIQPECHRVLRITTMWLKLGAELDLTPYELGLRMCRQVLDEPSELEKICWKAEDMVEAKNEEKVEDDDVRDNLFYLKLSICMREAMEEVKSKRSQVRTRTWTS